MKTGRSIERLGLSTEWERSVTRTAIVVAALALVASVGLAAVLVGAEISAWVWIPLCALIAYLTYSGMTHKIRRRQRILSQPFPAEWEAVLQREVLFFRALDPDEQQRFRRELQVFIGEKLITGIKMEMDSTTRVLTAASAIIPIFGFPEWEWDQISEILSTPIASTANTRLTATRSGKPWVWSALAL